MWMFGGPSGGSPGVSQAFYDLGFGGGTTVALTIDDAWHIADLSATVPITAKAVLFRGQVSLSTAWATMQVKQNGASGNSASLVNNYANTGSGTGRVTGYDDLIVAVDDTRKIQYIVTTGASAVLRIVGYWV
jgi:hypothetical protein